MGRLNMKKEIDVKLFNEAINKVVHRPTILLFGADRFIDSCWDEYNTLVIKSKEDKKAFNGNSLMNIPGVRGFNFQENRVEVRTNKGIKTYKVGRVKMETIEKRLEEFLRK